VNTYRFGLQVVTIVRTMYWK